jgi:D-serine deaminase-like pyridoxal phosphate-dependent protein
MTSIPSIRFTIAFLFAASACAVKTEKAADTLAVVSSTSTSTSDITVTENGIGPIHAGMTVAQANAAIGGGFAAPKGGTTGCTYAVLTKAPRGLWVMLQDGRVARVEVRSGSIATSTGARIGDSETRIKQLYPGVATTPHKYVAGGHYLTVIGSDPANRIVFETDGSKVTTFRSGRTPEVENVEGCG